MTNAEKKFNSLVQRYYAAFYANNGYKPFEIYFQKGWVHLRSKEEYSAAKYRVKEFEKMTLTLESRIHSLP